MAFFLTTSKFLDRCPVFKSGEKDNMSNYRPISCLPVLSELGENIVFQRLYFFI